MRRKTILRAVAGAAIFAGCPAIAQHGHSGGGGPAGGGAPMGGMGTMNGNAGGMGNMNVNVGTNSMDMRGTGIETRDAARVNSQATTHASPTGVAHANSNSVLAGTSGTTTTLTGVTTGMALMSNGTQVGTVTRVVTNGQGMITRVLVQGTNGRTFSLAPSSLSLSGGTLTTTTPLRM